MSTSSTRTRNHAGLTLPCIKPLLRAHSRSARLLEDVQVHVRIGQNKWQHSFTYSESDPLAPTFFTPTLARLSSFFRSIEHVVHPPSSTGLHNDTPPRSLQGVSVRLAYSLQQTPWLPHEPLYPAPTLAFLHHARFRRIFSNFAGAGLDSKPSPAKAILRTYPTATKIGKPSLASAMG